LLLIFNFSHSLIYIKHDAKIYAAHYATSQKDVAFGATPLKYTILFLKIL